MAKKKLIEQGKPTRARGGGKRTRRRAQAPAGVRLERVALTRIKAAAYNPRKDLQPGDPEYEKLRRSVDEFGLVEPLVWNKRSGNLVGGHQRLKLLIEQGATAVDVSVVDLPPVREQALNVALNKISGEWDDERLTLLLGELRESDKIDETLTGFDQVEIQAMLAEVSGDESESGEPQLGELEYRLVVDCRDEQHQRRLLERLEKQGLSCRALIS